MRWIVVLVAMTLPLGDCEQQPPRHVAPGRVAIIAIDGASPRLVETWMADGLLPNLARLEREGVYGHSLPRVMPPL